MMKRTDLAKKVKKFGKEVLSNMPSKKQIRAQKKQQQRERHVGRILVADEIQNIEVILKQQEEVRAELDSLGDTPDKDMQKFFK